MTYLLALALLSVFPSPVQAEVSPDCVVEHLKSKGLADRSSVIRFPTGTAFGATGAIEITVIGHNHGSRSLATDLQNLIGQRDLSNARFSTALDRLADSKADRDSSDDVDFLRGYLSRSATTNVGQPKFVGIEGTQSAVDANVRAYESIRSRLVSEITRRKLMKADGLMKSAFGPESFLKLTEPSLFKNKTLIGIENAHAAGDFTEAQNSYDLAFEKMKHIRVGEESSHAFDRLAKELSDLYPTYSASHDDARILSAARATFSASELKFIEPYLKARLKLMQAMKMRDQKDVESILERKASGVVLVGSTHLASMTELLEGMCCARLSKVADGSRCR